ncbi:MULTISPECIES: MarR family winged helix-turn-helix transcriptional regulator [unclassified Enterococcus]|uniref:MarR family winged helix-turn-helix transcriptional regulator n=1 Tax=unclassified Enterococcus TaxID=2608891 RepID=UPI001CE22A99|nr:MULTISPECIES: MarR family transcriptional regulator [unclassified Enterococcus]MCA5013035.1 MarR family transcriptional regulator [Enterococcus sp. S23]MCA5016285.1 MarR family transcriptional regulator [Enterococcus sp. S22(2020)]
MDHQEESLKTYIGILRTASQLEQLAKKDVTCYGLNITEFSVLELLFHKGRQTTQTIKEKILIASSSTTYVIDQLTKKGYVKRQTNESDRRIIYVDITVAGKTLMEEIFPTHAQQIAASFSDITIEELRSLQHLLKKIND